MLLEVFSAETTRPESSRRKSPWPCAPDTSVTQRYAAVADMETRRRAHVVSSEISFAVDLAITVADCLVHF